MKHGYYWVRRGKNPKPEIAYKSKQSGWQFFDGSQVKMVKQRVIMLCRIDDYVEPIECDYDIDAMRDALRACYSYNSWGALTEGVVEEIAVEYKIDPKILYEKFHDGDDE